MFEIIIESLAFAGIGIAFIRSYLVVNKVWGRKHERVVAESISVMANILGLVTALPFLIKYIIAGDFSSTAGRFINLAMSLLFLFIGIGIWVRGANRGGFWRQLLRSLNLERKEMGYLVRQLIRPTGSKEIIDILEQIAHLDRNLDAREVEFINTFAQTWNINWHPTEPTDAVSSGPETAALIKIRDTVNKYLSLSPPAEQAIHLRDVIHALVKIDKDVSAEERQVVAELEKMLESYAEGEEIPSYEVLVVPQSDEQLDAIKSLLSARELTPRCGGHAFVIDRFYTESYADSICSRYRELNLFTTIELLPVEQAA